MLPYEFHPLAERELDETLQVTPKALSCFGSPLDSALRSPAHLSVGLTTSLLPLDIAVEVFV